MKTMLKAVPAALLAVMPLSMLVPATAQAEVSANVGVSSMYLWRGQNVSPDGGVVSGGLDYGHDSGFYAGVWTTSENGGHETDLYLGFGTEVSGLGIDLSYWNYLYPEDGLPESDLEDTNAAEVALGLSYGPVSFGAYVNVDSDNDDDQYYTLGYGMDKFSATYGVWSLEETDPAVEENNYSHITLGYDATDELSFALNFTINEVADDEPGALQTDPLFGVTYTKTFDL